MKKLLLLLLTSLFFTAQAEVVPQWGVAAGYYDAGKKHSGSLAQFEYKWGDYLFWKGIRPQVGFAIPEFKALYFYGSLAFELHMTKHIIIAPSFGPGVYFEGFGGRNLGYPLEFRSCIEIACESSDFRRFGIQFFHISNASLGSRNPGANALMFFIALPLY